MTHSTYPKGMTMTNPTASTAAGDYTPVAVAELIDHLTSVIHDEKSETLDLLDSMAALIEGYNRARLLDGDLIAALDKGRLAAMGMVENYKRLLDMETVRLARVTQDLRELEAGEQR